MTQEDKAKAYDEAIKKIKGYITDEFGCTRLKPSDIFPELAESEDESIMKSLIGHLRECRNQCRSEVMIEEYAKWIAWLEKQKEVKPVKTAIEAWKEMRLEVYAQASGDRHEPNYSDDYSRMFSLNDIDEIFEKVSDCIVKQKPTEWSEEDERIRYAICDTLDRIDEHIMKYNNQLTHQQVKDWLKSIKERINV